MNLKEIEDGVHENPFWMHLYGTPTNVKNKNYRDYVFNNHKMGSCYVGSMLLGAKMTDTNDATVKC